jgi:hypothetical protein
MKRLSLVCLVMLMAVAMPLSAQTSNTVKKQSLGSRISQLFKKTKKSVVRAGENISDAIGFDDLASGSDDLYKIKGNYYMPLYTVNLYKGEQSEEFRKQCRQKFSEKYPQAKVVSVALPQTEWLVNPVKKNDQITGYVETMYCYVLARDGGDGYINAKFTYQQYKDAGESYGQLANKWPQWTRTDIMTNEVYQKLLSK